MLAHFYCILRVNRVRTHSVMRSKNHEGTFDSYFFSVFMWLKILLVEVYIYSFNVYNIAKRKHQIAFENHFLSYTQIS